MLIFQLLHVELWLILYTNYRPFHHDCEGCAMDMGKIIFDIETQNSQAEGIKAIMVEIADYYSNPDKYEYLPSQGEHLSKLLYMVIDSTTHLLTSQQNTIDELAADGEGSRP